MNLPNKITLSRICLVPVFMLFIVPLPDWLMDYRLFEFINTYGKYIATFLFILAASTDAVDGYIARKTNQLTKFGKFIDPIADKLLVAAALFVLVQRGDVSSWAAMIIIAREFLVTGLRLVAAGEGEVIQAGFWGKLKTVLQMTAIAAAMMDNFPITYFTSFPLDDFLMALAVIVTIYSGYDYFAKNMRYIDTF